MSTLSDVASGAQALVSAASTPVAGRAHVDLPALSDDRVVQFIEMADEQAQLFGEYRRAGLSELERRIRERRESAPQARAIPHPQYEIELVDEFTPYRADLAGLHEAVAMLPEEEAAKVLRAVPGRVLVSLPEQDDAALLADIQAFAKARGGHVEIIAAHHECGNVSSILALAKKYAGTPVGERLGSSITRDRTGEKLVFKQRKGVR